MIELATKCGLIWSVEYVIHRGPNHLNPTTRLHRPLYHCNCVINLVPAKGKAAVFQEILVYCNLVEEQLIGPGSFQTYAVPVDLPYHVRQTNSAINSRNLTNQT